MSQIEMWFCNFNCNCEQRKNVLLKVLQSGNVEWFMFTKSLFNLEWFIDFQLFLPRFVFNYLDGFVFLCGTGLKIWDSSVYIHFISWYSRRSYWNCSPAYK
jgi:hypothetical protein